MTSNNSPNSFCSLSDNSFSAFCTPILNKLCIVFPPTLYAAAPVGVPTCTVLFLLNIVLITLTKVFMRRLFPVPAIPDTVIRSGSNFFEDFLQFIHSLIFASTTNAILNCSSFKSFSLKSVPSLVFGICTFSFLVSFNFFTSSNSHV